MAINERNPLNGTEVNPPVENQSGHVYVGDEEAEYADRRNQPGQAFDDNVNEETVGQGQPQSAQITENNRYASPENAQKRTLNPDGSEPSTGSE